MVVFAFANNGDGGYYIASDRATTGCRRLPSDLDREMERIRIKGEEVKAMSIGRNGDWFLRTDTRYACKTEHRRGEDWISNVERFAKLVQEAGLSLADYVIQFFTFVPDPTGYVVVLQKADGSLTQCSWHNVPQKLDELLEREGRKGVRHVTVGVNGSYVVVMNSGVVLSSGIPIRLQRQLEDATNRKCSVATISLSLILRWWYLVEFTDGVTEFFLPAGWHNSINSYITHTTRANSLNPRMTTSYNSDTHSHSHSHPQHAQFGSSDPVSTSPLSSSPVDSYGGGSVSHSPSLSHPQHAQFGSASSVSTSPISSGSVSSYVGGSGAHSHPQHIMQFGSSNPVSTSPASLAGLGPVNSYSGGSGAHSRSYNYPRHAQIGSSNPISIGPASPISPTGSSPVTGPVGSYGGGYGALSHPQPVQFGLSSPVRSSPVISSPVSSYSGSATPAPAYTSSLYHASVSAGLQQQPVHNITQLYNSSMPQQQQQQEPKQQQEQQQQQQWLQQASTLPKYDGTFGPLGGTFKRAGADS